MFVGLDAETLMIEDGKGVPPMVCFGYGVWNDDDTLRRGGIVTRLNDHWWWGPHGPGMTVREKTSPTEVVADLTAAVFKEKGTWGNQNTAFDTAVLMNYDGALVDPLLDIYAAGLVECTILRERIMDNGMGLLDFWYRPEAMEFPLMEGGRKTTRKIHAGRLSKKGYSLAEMSKVHLGVDMDKETWRTGYSRFWDTPLAEWPAGARDYVYGDVEVMHRLFLDQGHRAHVLGWDKIPTSADQAHADLALHLQSMWGMRTDPVSVARYKAGKERLLAVIDDGLKKAGLLKEGKGKAKGKVSRDTKAMQAALRELERKTNQFLPRTATGLISTAAEDMEALSERMGILPPATAEEATALLAQEDSEELSAPNALAGLPDFRSSDRAVPLMSWHVTTEKMLSTYVPPMERAGYAPLQGRYVTLQRTGRTSMRAPNLQNLPKDPGIRECYVPRPGFVFCSVDYAALELHTLAQMCLHWLKFSELAKALNAKKDPHAMLAAEHIVRISYDEFVAIRKSQGPNTHPRKAEIVHARDIAKAGNFGLPGGLGADSFWAYCRGEGIKTMTLRDAEHVKESWRRQWPEMPAYFQYINRLMGPDWIEDHLQTAQVVLPTGLVRGRAAYTEGCNFPFQGLAAAGGKAACADLAQATYRKRGSLYGSRAVLFVHDEVIMEHPENEAHDRAYEQTRIMLAAMGRFLPDVPPKAEPALMRRWYKAAEAVFGPDGKLIPWEPESVRMAA